MKSIWFKLAFLVSTLSCCSTLIAAEKPSTTSFKFSETISSLPVLKDLQLVSGAFNNQQRDFAYIAAAPMGLRVPNDSSGYFTAIEYALQHDLTLSGQWSRYQPTYNDFHSENTFFKALDTRLLEESRNTTARAVGLNWKMADGWSAYARVQTVGGSVWLPQLSIPYFITQDSQHWTLAAVEVVFIF